jgi:hypothetical protein
LLRLIFPFLAIPVFLFLLVRMSFTNHEKMYQFEANDPVLSRYTDVGLSDGGPNSLEDFTLSRDRMAEALKNSKKALKICSQNNPVILGDLLKCYGRFVKVLWETD